MISVVIPVYNEEESVINLYSELKHVLNQFNQYELIFVDDGSTDQTFEKLLQYTETDKQLKLVKFKKNFDPLIFSSKLAEILTTLIQSIRQGDLFLFASLLIIIAMSINTEHNYIDLSILFIIYLLKELVF